MSTPAPTFVIRDGSRMDILLRFYREHPGYHRCMDVAPQVNIPTHRVAVVSMRLYERGAIDRRQVRVRGRIAPVTLYGIAVATPVTPIPEA